MPRKPRKTTYAGAVKLRQKPMSNGHRSLYLDIYHLGKRSYQFLSLYLTGDKIHDAEMMRVAETIRSRKEIEVQAGEHGVTPAHLKEGDFKAYLDKLAEEKGHPNYQVLAKHFRTFTGSRKVTFATLSPGLMEEFREWLLGQFSRNTAGLYFGYFKSSVRWAKEKGLLIRDPGEAVRAIKPVDIDRTFLSLDELRKLDATPCVRPEIRRAFLFACYTGLRISDIRALTWGKINNGRIEYRQRKTGKVEYLPLSEAATRYLGEPGEPDAPVFTLPASSNLYHGLNKWALSAGLGKVISFHVSRHTFATLTLTHGADLYTVSKLLGHSNIQTTQIYAKIVDEKKREAVNLIPAL